MFDLQSLVKYLLEGAAVAVAAYLIPRKKVDVTEIALIALTAAAVFAVLDSFAPLVAVSARHGAGFGIGYQQVGFGRPGFEGFNGQSLNKNDFEGYDDYEQGEGFQDATATSPGAAGDPSTTTSTDPSLPSNTTVNVTSSPGTPSGPTSTGPTSTNDDDVVDSQNVCQLNGDNCSYTSTAKDDQKAHFICRKDGTSCRPVKACKKIGQGTGCDWSDEAKPIVDAQTSSDPNRPVCQMQDVNGKQHCRLTQPSRIEGFEGFSKVF